MGRLVELGFVVLFFYPLLSQRFSFCCYFENDSISFRWFILLMAVVNIEAQKKPSISKFVSANTPFDYSVLITLYAA